MSNVDSSVVRAFGEEWSKFNHLDLDNPEMQTLFGQYFAIFPWHKLPPGAVGFDLGCGTGRWAYFVAKRVGYLHCIDASEAALSVARRNLRASSNCSFHHSTVDAIPLTDSSVDFGYSLGVLHHIPDTQRGIIQCVRKLKAGAPLLIYLYYAFDNRPVWFRMIWRLSDLLRRCISTLPFPVKSPLCDLLAAFVYWPLARSWKVLERFGVSVESLPLSAYRDRSFYVMRTDALDRFGTRLEKRFSRAQIQKMMKDAGLVNITFSNSPCWCAVGYRKR